MFWKFKNDRQKIFLGFFLGRLHGASWSVNRIGPFKRVAHFMHMSITRNTCMQQPLAYILQTLFQHEVFVITSTLNAGSGCSRHVSHGNTIIVF
jgi:hypothetical protein